MNRKSDRTGAPRLSMLMLISAVVLATIAIGFILADSGDIPNSEGATSGKCGDDLTWTIDSEGDLKIEGSGPMYDFTSSSTRWGGNEVRSVEIGDSVTSIGDYAFSHCTALTAVTIGNSVTSIGECAFSNCHSLASIDIPDSVTYIGKWAVYTCISLTTVIIPDSVTSIGDQAFAYCTSLISIIIGDSVTFIGSSAFFRCTSLTTVFIPDSVTWIGAGAFSSCTSLISIQVDTSNAEYCSMNGVLYNQGKTVLFAYPVGRTDSSFSIPNSVISIETAAFESCVSLTSVTIPDSVERIRSYAFSQCTSLTSVTIPDSVTFIERNAFSQCTSLTSLTIPDSVGYIGDYAFYYCTSLVSIEVAGLNQQYRSVDGVLYSKDMTVLLQYPTGKANDAFQIPDSVTSIGQWAFSNSGSLTTVTIPDSVTSIGLGAFDNCTSLTTVTIGNSVTSIGTSAFSDCTSLTSITIPDSVISLGEWAFTWCTSLTSVTIGDSVTSIGEKTFYNCTSLTTITIPDSVTSIGAEAFGYCTSLTSISIPDSVTSIGDRAFCSHTFYDTDGVTVLEPTASDLAGHTFVGESIKRMIKQDPRTLTFDDTELMVIQDGKVLTSPAEVGYGSKVVVAAYSKAGYAARIMAGTVEIASGSEYTVTGDVVFKVTYVPETCTLTIVGGTAEVFSRSGLQLRNGSTVSYGDIVTVEPIVPEGKYVAGGNIVGLADNGDGTYTVTGNVSVEFLFEDAKTFDLYLRNSKNPGVDFYLNDVKVEGTVSAKTGDRFEAKVRDGYFGTPVVTIGGIRVGNPCELTFGGAVSVSGVEEIVYTSATISGEVVGQVVFAEYQVVTVSGTCTLAEGAVVLVNCRLVVPEGATLTVQGGAVLMAYDVSVEGTLVTDGVDEDSTAEYKFGTALLGVKSTTGTFPVNSDDLRTDGRTVVSGSIVDYGAVGFVGEASVSGSLTVGEDGGLVTEDCALEVTGTVEIYGLSQAAFQNRGTIVFDSAAENGANTVYMLADDAVLDVRSYISADGSEGLEVIRASDGGCSSDIVMGMRTTSDGNVKVILAADDDGAIPSGTVTVTMSYAMVDEYGIWDIDSVRIPAEVRCTGDGYQIIAVTLTDNEYYPYATGVVASFTGGNGTYDSNKLQFTPMEV